MAVTGSRLESSHLTLQHFAQILSQLLQDRVIIMSQFANLSISDAVVPNITPRKETIRMLFEQTNWNDLIKNEVLRQRDVSKCV